MNGDFAIAVWDRREQELFLARDRFGVRPLFLAELGGDLVFASEAEGAPPPSRRAAASSTRLASSRASRPGAISPDARRSPASASSRPPTTCSSARTASGEERRWWDLDFSRRRRRLAGSADGARRASSRPARRRHAPAPARRRPGRGLPERRPRLVGDRGASRSSRWTRRSTASAVGFEDPRFDESAYQDRLAARARGRPHPRDRRRPRRSPSSCRRAVELAEKPTLRTAPCAAPAALGAPSSDAGLKVVTTGEGADELFARLRHLPRGQGAPLLGHASRTPSSARSSSRA